MLAKEAPTWLRIETQTPLRDAGRERQEHEGPQLVVRVDRGADLAAVRKALVRVAGRAAAEAAAEAEARAAADGTPTRGMLG